MAATRITRAPLRTLVAAAAVALAVTTTLQPTAHASVSATPTKTAGLSGEAVFDLAVLDSGRVILGGRFTGVGAFPRSNLGALLPSGKADPAFAPSTNGDVRAVAASEDGTRVFIGGTFTEVNGQPRQNLAALDAVTGALITDWQADTVGADPTVRSLDVHGDRLYVGGRFDGIDGTAKQKLAAVGVTSGNTLAWNTWTNGNVAEVRVSPDGQTVWVGGAFSKIRGMARAYFGGIDATTGYPNAFSRDSWGGVVITVGTSPDGGTVYVATENNHLFAYDWAASKELWRTRMSGNVQAIAASPTEIYIGGHFSSFADYKVKRPSLASVVASTGAPTSWDTKATGLLGGGWSLVIDGSTLHVGGQFTRFDGVQQRLYARFAGTPTP
ncbi:PQQ-binding-like beta-propeller repeat protein [Nocardioides silvaticus]|nr:PQQ-binding-like beta-propeller repeat protein [Nocardioides silvaticus]